MIAMSLVNSNDTWLGVASSSAVISMYFQVSRVTGQDAVMATYIAFLRAINLGAKRKFPKDAIKAVVEGAGFTDVETYINTGNVRLDSSLRSRAKIEGALEEAFLDDRGFEVPTIVFTQKELAAIADEAASFGHDGKHYVSLLKDAPTAAADARRSRQPARRTRWLGSVAAPCTCCSGRTTTRRS